MSCDCSRLYTITFLTFYLLNATQLAYSCILEERDVAYLEPSLTKIDRMIDYCEIHLKIRVLLNYFSQRSDCVMTICTDL